ncbi:MAG: tetratricopeptide repeat protein [Planctomycetes bacterium]|nr:tetratricopeptide repeat protein [Planctomycetota bacterium]
MTDSMPRVPRLVRLYHRYLLEEDSARFIRSVADYYMTPTLARLAGAGDRTVRRAAVMALGYLGDYQVNSTMGRALLDRDRGVRLIAENAIRDIWKRDGADEHQKRLEVVVRWNGCGQFDAAADAARVLIEECPWYAEAWNQRAIALFQMAQFDASADDCQQTLELNPYHFPAAIGMGQCYLELDDLVSALECFRRGLKLNPNLESVRAQIHYLQRSLEGR